MPERKQRPKQENKFSIERRVPLDDVVGRYPQFANWLQEHPTAQTTSDGRLPSAEEKIDTLGGIEHLRRNFALANKKRSGTEYAILTSCQQTPMNPGEIERFHEMLTGEPTRIPGLLAEDLLSLEEKELISARTGIDYFKVYEDGFADIIHNGEGFVTTRQGLTRRALLLEDQPRRSLFGNLVPG